MMWSLVSVAQASPPPFPGAGELGAFGTALAWGYASVLFTRQFREHSPLDAALIKNTVGMIVLVIVAWWAGRDLGGGAAGEGDPSWLMVSGALTVAIGDFLYFTALFRLGVGRTLILIQLVPAVVSVTAGLIFAEYLGPWQWTGVAVVLLSGIVSESRGWGAGKIDWIGMLCVAGAIATYASGNLMTRYGMETTGPITGAAWRLVGAFLCMLVLLTLRGGIRAPVEALIKPVNWRVFWWPSLIGTGLGMALLMVGLKWAKQGVAASLSSATPLISIPLAAWILDEQPGWRGWLGALLAVLGAAILGFAATAT